MQNIDTPIVRPLTLADLPHIGDAMLFGSFSLDRANYEPCFNGALSAKYLLYFQVYP